MIRKAIYFVLFLFLAFAFFVYLISEGLLGTYENNRPINTNALPDFISVEKNKALIEAKDKLSINNEKVILFGDLHVHTTYSSDAFLLSLPMLSGEGSMPPSDACDFARFCSSLDFYANTDHAEDLTHVDWQETKDALRQCNNVSGNSESPDTIPFLGWEWSQNEGFGIPHYGHRNIILKSLNDDEIPTRPIASISGGFMDMPQQVKVGLSAMRSLDSRIHDLMTFINDGQTTPCPDNASVRDLPMNCKEYAANPDILFGKLNEWGHEVIVIPHGTTWGTYTPDESDWKDQLNDNFHDPNLQNLVEIYSGHGNTEEYRSWRSIELDEEGNISCPNPSSNFTPGCWQAGQIIKERCEMEGESERICNKRAEEARLNYALESYAGQSVIVGEDPSEWLDSNQCKDCFLPGFSHKPLGSIQYMLALQNFNKNDRVNKFRFGLVASSDNHTARPGTGYKEINRREMTEAAGPADPTGYLLGFREGSGPYGKSIRRNWTRDTLPPGPIEMERTASFFYTGGLVATHSANKSRDSIWKSLKTKEVYATSGTRILLWFDLLNSEEGIIPMGSETEMQINPRFIVKAAGSFKQKPGCPEYAIDTLGKERIRDLCRNECYNPSDQRKVIDRIEVIRILPQANPNEEITDLIQDPWKVHKCKNKESCEFSFVDNDFNQSKRDAVYYVRAIEESSKIINAGNLRCEFDEFGNCKSVNICSGSAMLTPYEEDCLSEEQERAWSSPIFVDYKKY